MKFSNIHILTKGLGFRPLLISVIFGSFLFCSYSLWAQQTPLSSGYFQNQYIINPAYAGIVDGLNVNVNFRNQWRVIPESPVNSTISADYRFNKVGLGLKLQTDKAGHIGRNAVSGTYAYHLPLASADQQVHFGLSLGVMKDRFESSGIIGEVHDPRPSELNARKIYLDGDFGLGYSVSKFNVQGSIPHLKTFFKKDSTNSVQFSTAYLSMSYTFGKDPNIFTLEPKLSYLASNGVEDIITLGAHARVMSDQFSVTALFHSSRSSSIGIGFKYDKYQINGYYTSQTVNGEGLGGTFEIHVKMNFLKRDNVYNMGTTTF